MKKEFLQYNHLSDGSRYYGNGVWGPSTVDLQRANLSFNEEPKTKEKPSNHLLFVSQESVVGRLLQTMSKVKLPAKFAIPGSMATVLLVSACGGVGEKNTQELENKESSGYALPFPKGETWFLTGGPHADGLSNGVRYAIDIAPPEGGFCPADGRKFTIDNRVVAASASGEVTTKGDDKNRNDPHHSEIRIKDKNGLTQVYIHLDNTTKVKVGNKVKQGDSLGNPSCEFPPGGANTGPHVHIGLMKDGQAIPIDGAVVGGWTIHENGTMTKPGEQPRTANVGRYGENSTGIRNDLPNGPRKEVLGKSQISVEKPVEKGWTRLKSRNLPYTIDYPSSWQRNDWYPGGIRIDKPIGDEFLGEIFKIAGDEVQVRIVILAAEFDQASFGVENAIIDGQKASKYESVNPFTHDLQYLFVRDGKLWQISFHNNRSVFDKELPTFEKMLASFKLLDGPIRKPTPTRVSEEQVEINWTRFKSFDLPYQIDYPSNWQQAGNGFYGETTKANPTKFEVASEPVASWITIDDYKNRFVQSVKDAVKLFGGDARITEMPSQTVGGQKAWKIDLIVSPEYHRNSFSLKDSNRSVTYITIKDGKAWVVAYAADSSEFDQNLPTFEKMLASFKFLK